MGANTNTSPVIRASFLPSLPLVPPPSKYSYQKKLSKFPIR